MNMLATQSKIDNLEAEMFKLPDLIDISTMDVRHHFTDSGLYAREMILPKGIIIVGKIKKHEHISVISAGFVTEVTNAGIKHIRAPFTMLSLPATKRVVWAHEVTVWTTIHATTETDLDKIEEDLIAIDYEHAKQYMTGLGVST